MAETKTTLTWLLKDQVSPTAAKINDHLKALGATGDKSGGIMGKLGALTGGLVNPLTLAAGATTVLTGLVAEWTDKAAKQEVLNTRLAQTLKDNIPGFNGNIDAIKSYIEAQTNLGFSIDETTASYAQLVTATHDTQKAQEFQQAAMDLARLKGISLADATDALTKVEGGHYRVLQSLGINLKANASATDALAAVQQAAGGQAEAYGKTTAGAFAKINAKLDDATTKLGEFFLPIITTVASFIADTLIPIIEQGADAIGPVLSAGFEIASKAIGVLVAALEPAIAIIKDLIGFIHDALRFLGILNDTPVNVPPGITNDASHHAAGGTLSPGWNLVGEQGPELISPSRQVYTAGQTQQMLAPQGSPVTIHLQVDGQTIARVVDEHLYYRAHAAAPSQLRG